MKKLVKILLFILVLASLIFATKRSFINSVERLPHADESEQATIFEKLDKTGFYKYDPNGSHGATLYYYTKVAKDYFFPAEIESIKTSEKDKCGKSLLFDKIFKITLLRLPIFAFAALTAAAILIALNGSSFIAGMVALLAFAFSSLAGIYSVYFVQEMIFAFSVFSFAFAFFSLVKRPSAYMAIVSGLFAGLAQSTKETFPFFFFAVLIASFIENRDISQPKLSHNRLNTNNKEKTSHWRVFALASIFTVTSIIVCAAFYTSFGKNSGGFCDMFSSYIHFAEKANGVGHESPCWYYLSDILLLKKSEGFWFGELPISLLSLCGILWSFFGKPDSEKLYLLKIRAKYASIIAIISLAIFSAIPYKTPWLMLSTMVFMCMLAGVGAMALLRQKRLFWKFLAFAVIVGLGIFQFRLSQNAVSKFPNDPRNPFIYSHTTTGIRKIINRVDAASKVSEYEMDMPIAVIMAQYESPWPLPWFFSNFRNAGFWNDGSFPSNYRDFEILVVDSRVTMPSNFDESAYISDFAGLRRELNLALYIKKDLFDRISK